MRTPITKESLIAYGMQETGDPVVPLKKIISVDEDDVPNDDDQPHMAICVSRYRNADELTLSLPNAGLLYLNIGSIEELKTFEETIQMWEPEF